MRSFILKAILHIMRALMSFIYFFIKIFTKQKNKVVMLSRQSDEISIDFKMLKEELEEHYPEFNVVVLCKMIPKEFFGRIKYCLYIIKCMYHLATSVICIVDGYVIPVSALKHKENLVIVQIWHAMGAIKQFGYQVLGKKEGTKQTVANIMKMHKNYTFITCTSMATRKIYSKAFDVPEEKIMVLGMPRIDYVLGKNDKINNKISEMLNDYPKLKEKPTIVYVPTFRKGKSILVKDMLEIIDTEKYNLIIKLHPLDNTKVDERYRISSKYNTFELLKIADYVITDYSAIAFEASILNKPTFFYLYDINEYKENRGLNINVQQEMKCATFQDFKSIYKIIEENNYNMEELENFRKKYVETNDVENSKRIIQEIMKVTVHS